jgi:hypothetical protein
MAPRPSETTSDVTGIKSALAVNPAAGNVVLDRVSRAIYVGATGNIVVQFAADKDSETVTIVGLAAGVWHPMQVQRIMQTGTTATGVVVGF